MNVINKFLILSITIASAFLAEAYEVSPTQPILWEQQYENLLLKKVGAKLPELVTYPFFQFPNEGHEVLESQFPEGKVLIFGYGSLMNKISAGRHIKKESIDTMYPAIAFGVKRIFNYKAAKTEHWGADQNRKEKAMLNIVQTLNIASKANGVAIEVDLEDLQGLVSRETGYDLVPIVISSWNDVLEQKDNIEMRIAYTFVATNELRNHIDYTSTEFYPVRGYLHAVQISSEAYGADFAKMWNDTTYLADGTTSINDWDEETFLGILCTQKP